MIHQIELTAKAPAKWWLGDDPFLFERPIFMRKLSVFERVNQQIMNLLLQITLFSACGFFSLVFFLAEGWWLLSQVPLEFLWRWIQKCQSDIGICPLASEKSVNISPEDMLKPIWKADISSVKSCEVYKFILKKVVSSVSSVQNYLKMMINCAHFGGLFNHQLDLMCFSKFGRWYGLPKTKKVLVQGGPKHQL